MRYVPLIKEKYEGNDYTKLNIPNSYKQTITDIGNLIAAADYFNIVDKIVLFGSCAKQTTHAGSDIDILLVTETQLTPDEIGQTRHIINKNSNIEVDVIFYQNLRQEYPHFLGGG